MSVISIINCKTARAIFYIIFIGGLLAIVSGGIAYLWNLYISPSYEVPEITLLEATGLLSFAYVIYFGIRFGKKKIEHDNLTSEGVTELQKSDKKSHFTHNCISKLNSEEKEFLKKNLSSAPFIGDSNKNSKPKERKRPDISGTRKEKA